MNSNPDLVLKRTTVDHHILASLITLIFRTPQHLEEFGWSGIDSVGCFMLDVLVFCP